MATNLHSDFKSLAASIGGPEWNGDAADHRDIEKDAGRLDTPHPGETFPPASGGEGKFEFLLPPTNTGDLGQLSHYRVLQLLGKGGMGMVFLAEDTNLKRSVALKVMQPELARDALARQRFLREARATAAIRSEHIVTIHEVGQAGEVPFLVMECLQGQSLHAWLKRGGQPTPEQVIDLGRQLARGLEAAHAAGLVHRDIKPANIWLDESAWRVKILDFGLARLTQDSERLTHTGDIIGTPVYMAPEQAEGAAVDERSDLFSLGCVLYELASGQIPFPGDSVVAVLLAKALNDPKPLHELSPALPSAFSALVMRLLAKKPADRPQSASEVIRYLEEIRDGAVHKDSDRESGRHARPMKPARRDTRHSPSMNSQMSSPTVGKKLSRLMLMGSLVLLFMLGGFLGIRSVLIAHGPERETDAGAAAESRPVAAGVVQGVTGEEILLGMSAPFSGPSQDLGRDAETGINTYFSQLNDQGGIAGRKVKIVVLDDGYQPERALANIKELYERHKVFAVMGNVGTSTAEKAMPYALDKEILFFGAITGGTQLRRDPPDRFVFNFRASFEEETAAIVKYLVEVKKIRPEEVAVFAQQDAYGDAGIRGVARMMRKYGFDRTVCVGYARNSIAVTAAVEAIKDNRSIRAVIMVATYRPAAEFIHKVKASRRDMLFSNVSFVGADSLADELLLHGPDCAEGVIVTQVVPPVDSQSSVVRKYRDHLRQYRPNEQPSFLSLEGYLTAAVLAEGLRRAGDNLTTATLIDALESIDNQDLGIGAPVRFSPSEHQASHKVWGTVLDREGKYQVLELE